VKTTTWKLYPNFWWGDEAHTHLVKGLDVTLANNLAGSKWYAAQESGRCLRIWVKPPYFAENKTDAKALIGTDLQLSPNWDAKCWITLQLSCVDQRFIKAVAITPAGLVVHVRTLTFSAGESREFVRSWEVPREQTYATASDARHTRKRRLPLPSVLLDRLKIH
jgi:hypothetical protein